ncbi:N-acylglucosamine 2-epimerase [candidate division MSBL1 archaeon SCGC-AAA259E19]|uniref:N-acylglucosamine 2-epimerase n=1 Tax=candidate division MSBL1 archaeon SCGC-AAA259E19 TaxID=1698264 RepID=A0A133UDC3_9EURY|nr:N-acylglucosamine 2-epimerase [candidate division MSBL1 archaeon SCGC-AAA259E19]
MEFRKPSWLRQHVLNILNFYYPDCIDHRYGGYISQLSDRDGHIYDGRSKSQVSTCRLIFNFSVGDMIEGPDWCRSAAKHGLDFLLSEHREEDGGYPWLLKGRSVEDPTRRAYAHAFALLAVSTASKADIPGADKEIEPTYRVIEEHFMETERGLCKPELGPDWEEVSPYRGQNANMHMCEALISAYEATENEKYLDDAVDIATALAKELTDKGEGLLWEHYDSDWEIDWDYNRDQPDHLFRPWGYQPGHLMEWSKLLLILDRYVSRNWFLDRAEHFFRSAVEKGWDSEYGGFYYSFDRNGKPILEDKYYWKLAEGSAAAALLAHRTGDDYYWEWYDRIWKYAWENMINKKYGNWYFKLTRDNEIHEGIDSTPEIKVGYHPLSACYEVMKEKGKYE